MIQGNTSSIFLSFQKAYNWSMINIILLAIRAYGFIILTVKNLIKLGRCPVRSLYSLGEFHFLGFDMPWNSVKSRSFRFIQLVHDLPLFTHPLTLPKQK